MTHFYVIKKNDKPSPGTDQPLQPGTYNATAISLSAEARRNSVFVNIGEAEIFKKDAKEGFLVTDSLQSCFPVILLFKNKDIVLYHGNTASIEPLLKHLQREDLQEIQLFAKPAGINPAKVAGFLGRLEDYFVEHNNPNGCPEINTKNGNAPYGVVVCYRSPDDEPIILVGQSGEGNELVDDPNKCINANNEKVEKCTFTASVLKPKAEEKSVQITLNYKQRLAAAKPAQEQPEAPRKNKSCNIM